ncbi:MAG: SAM-dependent chlorinase/fluorinase [Thermoleophilia bacterium]
MVRPRTVCFFSDYGLDDAFAGTCRAVIARLEPNVSVIDITHGLPQFDVLGGALALRDALPYLPERSVVLGVVDPGVGGVRRAIALRSADDCLFVGPDNGLLVPAAEVAGAIAAAHELCHADLRLASVGHTFHGRDVFAPAAARLAAGFPLDRAGPRLEPSSLRRLELPVATVRSVGLSATVVGIDRFGNVALGADADDLSIADLGDDIDVVCNGGAFSARVVDSFGGASAGCLVVFVDSGGRVALAVARGSAAAMLDLVLGSGIELRRRKP